MPIPRPLFGDLTPSQAVGSGSIADRIQPRDIAVFHGLPDLEKLNLLEKWMIKKTEAPLGDFRGWGATTSWATASTDGLKEALS